MLLSADMLCLVQSFQQARESKKASKTRKLPFVLRRKHSPEPQDENRLHPESAGENVSLVRAKSKHGLKKLSGSVPSMTCTSISPAALTPTTCRSRQKKFHRHFKVDPEEQVIDYYSCALVADILLQGHLYISKNYFAFYSNVFGYVTKLLIPTSSVVTVTKEKTAYILPNAVGVATADDKHVFSSLLSRDTTYRLMVQVWRAAHSSRIIDDITVTETEVDGVVCEESSSLSGSESAFEIKTNAKLEMPTLSENKELTPNPSSSSRRSEPLASLSRSTFLLGVASALLVVLFLSASVLLYRVTLMHQDLTTQQAQAQGSRSIYEVQEFLDMNLNNLNKVRQSLEELSLLLQNEKEKLTCRNSDDNHLLESSNPPKMTPTATESETPLQTEELAQNQMKKN